MLNSNISFLIYIKAIVKYLPGFNLNIKIWGNCIYFQFCLILIVSVDMVILYFTKKKIQKKIWITQDIDISGDIYQQMSKRQPRKPVIDGIWETREKGRSRSSEWSNTKIWGEEKSVPSLKNMNNIANCKLISKIDKRGITFHSCYVFAIA